LYRYGEDEMGRQIYGDEADDDSDDEEDDEDDEGSDEVGDCTR
jgi:hypothetical protein